MEDFKVIVRATSIKITPGKEAFGRLTPLVKLHTYTDDITGDDRAMGFIYDEPHDTLYFHKGVDISYVRRLLGSCKVIQQPFDEYKDMKYQFEEVTAPRDEDQRDVINFISGNPPYGSNIKNSQIFLVKKPGFGKAEPYTRKIPTPTEKGYTLMGDLKVGDKVFGADGKPTTVTGIFEQGKRDIYEITFSDGRQAYCSDHHLWKVFTGCGKEYVLETKDLIHMYRRHRESDNPNREPYVYHFKIPVCKPVQYPKPDRLPIDPWVLGCFIGNGCCREKPLSISCGDDEIPKRIAKICGYNVRRNSDHNYTYTFVNPITNLPIHTDEFFSELPEFIGAYSYQKSIPDMYMYADVETRLAVLQGLMDTDGHISINENRFHVGYTSTSKKLLWQIQQLLYSFGWSGRVHTDKREHKYTTGFCGIIIFRMPNEKKYLLFRSKRKLAIAKKARFVPQVNRYNGLIIKRIRKLYNLPCRCIMVDNTEHLYLTEDFIVTHNTYCTGYGVGVLGMKTLIIIHRDNLRTQWYGSLVNMNGYPKQRVFVIDSVNDAVAIATGEYRPDADIYLVTHMTIHAALQRLGDMEAMSGLTRNLGIGMKVIDEAHLYFRSTLAIDCMFNVKRNLYLTATDGRSNKSEDAIFRQVFSNTEFYKRAIEMDEKHPSRWVDYITVFIDTHVKKGLYQYRVAPGGRMSPVTYGKFVIKHDKSQTHFKVCAEILRQIFEEDRDAKVLVFLPLIDLCMEGAYFFAQKLNYDDSFPMDLNIKTVHSRNSVEENELNKRADVIVTTVQSLGTGSDIKGVTSIINCTPLVSKINCEQILGRIRYINKPCHYYDIVDKSVQMDVFWWKSRSRTFQRLCTKSTQLAWTNDEEG